MHAHPARSPLLRKFARATLTGFAAVLVLAVSAGVFGGATAVATHGGTGNGAPNGGHYTLNIIGVPQDKTADMTGANGHVIFVPLEGRTSIWLCESGVDVGCGDGSFQVLDANGTDQNGALFGLPNPDPDGDGTTVYSVFARALGTPGGSADMTTCATDPVDDSLVCSIITLELERDAGRSRFDNVSKYLLYIYADIDGDTVVERVPLFDESLEGFFWDYDNHGLKLAQLRFYDCSTTVPEPDDPNLADPNNPGDDSDCFSGTH